jgi:hypothetical protein
LKTKFHFLRAAALSIVFVGAALGSINAASAQYYYHHHHFHHRHWVKDHNHPRGYWNYN